MYEEPELESRGKEEYNILTPAIFGYAACNSSSQARVNIMLRGLGGLQFKHLQPLLFGLRMHFERQNGENSFL